MRSEDWGLIDYESSTAKQYECVERVGDGAEDCVVLCSHPPVVTLGRGAVPEDLQGWAGTTIETSRGGRATYHGPNQVVIYPILDLKRERAAFRSRDVHAYLRALEEATVAALREMGLPRAEARTSKIGEISLTGVWVGEKKIASIGIAVRKWVSYHGVAVNLLADPQAFRGIRPCGFNADVMTSLEAELGRNLKMDDTKRIFGAIFRQALA
jgi:lipoate-protein ligase B